MKNIVNKIMEINFPQKLKRLMISVLCVALIGGGLSAFLLRGQIREVITNVQEWHEDVDDGHYKVKYEKSDYHEVENEHHKEELFENIHITEPSVAAKITIGITGLFFALAALVFWLLIAAWLYKAAVLSGMNGFLWFLLGLGGNVFAAILFNLVRSFKCQKCFSCGCYSSAAAQYCTKCGAALTLRCPECGEIMQKSDRFCQSCGKQTSQN